MKGIKIRPGRPSDASAIASILESADWPSPYFSDPESRQRAVQMQLAKGIAPNSHLLVSEIDDKVVGYVLWHLQPCLYLPGPEGTVSDLFVLGSARGMRVGRSLLRAAIDQAKDLGCRRLVLQTRKARRSYRRGFYPKQGWEERTGVASYVFKISR